MSLSTAPSLPAALQGFADPRHFVDEETIERVKKGLLADEELKDREKKNHLDQPDAGIKKLQDKR